MTIDLPLEEALALFSDLNTGDMKTRSSDCSAVDLLPLAPEPMVKEETAAQPPAKPKKKRIRRQKLELDYLRQLVGKLEAQMTQLKTQERAPDIKTEAGAPSIWKGIAERQQKERTRAEEQNQRLRVSLEGQLKLASKLERLLRKRPREEEVVAVEGGKRYKPLLDTAVRPTDDEIFADQLAHLERAHLDVGELFGGPEFADRTASFCDLHVMEEANSDTGVAFVTKANSMLPFDVHVTEKAFWRAFAEDGPKKMSYFNYERIMTENLVARSYGLNFDAGSFHTNVRGKQTYRKYVGGDCIIIMWKSRTEPVEINGTKLSGLRCNQIGWIVLRGVNLPSKDASEVMISTSLQSYCKMTLDLEDDIADQELQVGALTNFVVNSHDAITDVCGKMINQVLVEEDWNINGWLNNIVL
ncbi:EVI5 protein [Phytophthora cinnamomi]|uniref:EVI5 protein n=1 Tax=Phytophthora cinnamomi TaxID=4785 RepID=UPI00355A7F57|nr:EVI5 protein [Phytophthora cinnamomi]